MSEERQAEIVKKLVIEGAYDIAKQFIDYIQEFGGNDEDS